MQVWGKLTVDSVQVCTVFECVCVGGWGGGGGVSFLLRLEALQKQYTGEICGQNSSPCPKGEGSTRAPLRLGVREFL